MKKIILTFDIEYWFESLSLQKYVTGKETDSLDLIIGRILDLLAGAKSAATFFVTGRVLEQEPDIAKKISSAGHEIAVHSLNHKPLWQKTALEFNREIVMMSDKIKELTGQKPAGHRAVNFSLDRKTSWALGVLKNNNFKYDSSIFPLNMFIYGEGKSDFIPEGIIELPLSVFKKGFVKIPIAGGIYFRFMPYFVFKFFLKKYLKKSDAVLYFHSWELFDFKPEIPGSPFWIKWLKFYGLKKSIFKFKKLLHDFECISVDQYLKGC